jgi:hypothetical protein
VWDSLLGDLFRLGMGEATAMSAEHGDGLADLFQVLQPFSVLEGVAPADVEHAAAGPGAGADLVELEGPNAEEAGVVWLC